MPAGRPRKTIIDDTISVAETSSDHDLARKVLRELCEDLSVPATCRTRAAEALGRLIHLDAMELRRQKETLESTKITPELVRQCLREMTLAALSIGLDPAPIVEDSVRD